MQCSACLIVDQCPKCDVSLTLHLNQKILKCHYCGFSKNESKICNSCGLQTLERKGMGTQLVEDEIQKLFPNYKVGRLDFDNTRKKTSFKDIITAFENNDYQILVGPQMVTKRLDISKDSPKWLVGPGIGNTNPLGGIFGICILILFCIFYLQTLRKGKQNYK